MIINIVGIKLSWIPLSFLPIIYEVLGVVVKYNIYSAWFLDTRILMFPLSSMCKLKNRQHLLLTLGWVNKSCCSLVSLPEVQSIQFLLL